MPRLRDPSGQERLDEIRQPLFDTITQAVGESPIAVRSFFVSVQGKSKYQTNLRQNSQLEASVSFRVMGLALDAQNWNENNRLLLPLMMERSYILFQVGEKIYWQAQALYCAGRLTQVSAISQYAQAAPSVNERLYQRFGDVAVQGVALSGRHVVDIPELQSFHVDLGTEAASMSAGEIVEATPSATAPGGYATASGVEYVFSLKGLLRRPVQ